MAEQKTQVSNATGNFQEIDISGAYKDYEDRTCIINCDNGKVDIKMYKPRPNANGYYRAPTCIGVGSVNFPDDKEWAYTFDGTEIRWYNNTQWNKISIGGKWKTFESGLNKHVIVEVTADSDGEILVKFPQEIIKRPEAYGNINLRANKGYVRFPDDNKFSFQLSNDGNKISWSNKTEWTREE